MTRIEETQDLYRIKKTELQHRPTKWDIFTSNVCGVRTGPGISFLDTFTILVIITMPLYSKKHFERNDIYGYLLDQLLILVVFLMKLSVGYT